VTLPAGTDDRVPGTFFPDTVEALGLVAPASSRVTWLLAGYGGSC
jgi:hypothetical protein